MSKIKQTHKKPPSPFIKQTCDPKGTYNLIERKKVIQYFIDIKKIQKKEENKQRMIYEDTADDVYFPSLQEVAEKIKNNEDLTLQRKRTLIIDSDDENKDNKKQIVEINGELFIRKDDTFIKYEQN